MRLNGQSKRGGAKGPVPKGRCQEVGLKGRGKTGRTKGA